MPVLIWPDADKVGKETALKIGKHLQEKMGCTVKIIDVDDLSDGWDAADALAEGMTLDDFKEWAKKRTPQPEAEKKQEVQQDGPPLSTYEEEAKTRQEPGEGSAGDQDKKTKDEPKQKKRVDDAAERRKAAKELEEKNKEIARASDVLDGELPFRILGYNNGDSYYLPNKSQQLVPLNASGHNKQNFLWLAPIEWWEQTFPNKKGCDWDSATNAMMRWTQRSGVFEPHEMLRGRGAWIDNGRAVMHLGKSLYCEGQEMDPRQVDSEYVYELMPDLGVRVTDQPAATEEANQLVKLCKQLSWKNNTSAALLAGWCIVAPVSGILNWRPHIWITGPSGSGKSTIVYKIIGAVLGKMAIHVEGKTTEAGIRGQLGQDARPIIYDEAEGEDESSRKRLQGIIDLARVSSSGGRIMKGTQSGGSQSYSIRSCFCFSSINVNVKHLADESRISQLVLEKDTSPEAEAYYDQLHGEILDTFTPEFSTKMLTRSLQNLETLQKNSVVFSKVAARKFKSSRIADQLGEMLAGFYLCHSTKEITLEKAQEWIDAQDWEEMTTVDEKSDPERLLDMICTHKLKVNANHEYPNTTIGELILAAADEMDEIPQDTAAAELKRWGIKVEFNQVLIANKSNPLSRQVLRDSPWSAAWSRPLRELAGAEATPVTHFTPGIKSRATSIPLNLFR
jgi:putative DNA primase/helicase